MKTIEYTTKGFLRSRSTSLEKCCAFVCLKIKATPKGMKDRSSKHEGLFLKWSALSNSLWFPL